MADDPIEPISSSELLRAARASVGSGSLSEELLRTAREQVAAPAPTPQPMPELYGSALEPTDAAPATSVETPARPTPATAPAQTTRRPRRRSRSRPAPPTAPPTGPADGTSRRRLPRAARGLIPLFIVGFIFLSNFFGDEGTEPDSEPVTVTIATETTQSGVEVRSDEPSTNLALNRPVTASGQTSDGPAVNAVDGNPATAWNSGGFPAQWIDIDLGEPATIREVRLRVGQSPPVGDTIHVVLGRGPGSNGEELPFHRIEGETRDSVWITTDANEPWPEIDQIRVLTLKSPSWVSWFEIEVLGVRE